MEDAKRLFEFVAHKDGCPGERAGGFKTKVAGRWYRSTTPDGVQTCTCGLMEAIAAHEALG